MRLPYEISELESTRFGVRVAHITDSLMDPTEVMSQASHAGVNLLIVRTSVTEFTQIHAYEKCGFELMDSLVYYIGPTQNKPIVLDGFRIRDATSSDANQIASIASSAFTNYIGHYHVDPRIDSNLATDGYADWARRLVLSDHAHDRTFVALEGDRRVGFLSMTKMGSDVAEIILNAVHPSYQGQGLYRALLSHATTRAAELGITQITISTQLTNYRVQKVWSNFGMWLDSAFFTFHKWML